MEKLQNQVLGCKPSLLNITFFIDSKGKFKTSVYSITKLIREMGGSISFTLNSKVDYIITTSVDYLEKLKQTSIVNTIDKSKVCLISDEFFTISPDQRSSFKFIPLSNNNSTSTNELISSTSSLSISNSRSANNNNVDDDQLKIIINPRHIPSVCYGVNEKNQPYFPSDDYLILKSNLLSSTIIGKQNTNKFYYLELHQAIDKGNFKKYYRIYTQSGRTDEIHKSTSQHRYCNQGELKEAMDLYSSIYSQKIEDVNGYIEIEMSAITKIGSPLKLKQTSMQKQLDEKSNSTTVIFNEETGQLEESAIDFQRSYIDTTVCKLIETIYKETSKCLIKNFSLDVTENGIETQLGTLSIGQIDSAKLILNQIGKLLEQQPDQSLSNNTEQFEKLSSKFFQLVPTKISSRKNKDCNGAIINNESSLVQHLELLDMMRDLTVAFNSNKLTNQSRNHLDMKYYALNIDIQHLHTASADYQIFIRNFTNNGGGSGSGANSIHQQLIDSGKLEILNVFKLKKDQEESQFQGDTIGNCKYLYHGSKSSNLVGLLSRGILPPKIVTSKGGKRSDFGYLGSGIYFCDNILSSLDFTQPIGDKGSRLIIMSFVSLGNVKEYTVIQPHLTSPPTGFNSCKGVKSNGDFKENEFVIYSQNQSKLSFLIELNFKK